MSASHPTSRLLVAALVLAGSSLLLFPGATAARAQARVNQSNQSNQATQTPQQDANGQDEDATTPAERKQVNLLASLNLSPEQRAQIRAIREQTEQEGRPLVQRLRRARRALDAAIYFENADQSVVEERVREVSLAQTEVARLRAVTELRVRRVLTPEQLNILRDMRRQARLVQRENVRRGGARRSDLRDPLDNRRLRGQTPSASPDGAQPTTNPAFTPRGRRNGGGALRRRQRP